jgi:hypothetical protein
MASYLLYARAVLNGWLKATTLRFFNNLGFERGRRLVQPGLRISALLHNRDIHIALCGFTKRLIGAQV